VLVARNVDCREECRDGVVRKWRARGAVVGEPLPQPRLSKLDSADEPSISARSYLERDVSADSIVRRP
jgi:hypothetical protein